MIYRKQIIILFGIIFFSLATYTANATPFTINVSKSDITCFEADDGTAVVDMITGGTAPFTFEWRTGGFIPIPGETDSTITGLGPGNYWAVVYDNDGHSQFWGFSIIEPFDIQIFFINKTDVLCNSESTGYIDILAGGGTPPLQFSINDGLDYQASPVFSNLLAGDYYIRILDNNGCEESYISNPVTVNEPSPVSITGESSTTINCNGVDDGTVTVTASGGTGTLTYTLNPGGVSNTTGNFTGVGPGSYIVTVSDDNGCSDISGSFDFSYPPLLEITNEAFTPINCFNIDDGTITITASGGTGLLTYTIIPGGGSNNDGNFTGIGPGSYSITIIDENGCTATSNIFNFAYPPDIIIDNESSEPLTCNGIDDATITVSASGGTGTLTYELNPGGITNTTGIFTGLGPDTYTVEVTDDNACGPVISSPFILAYPASIVIDSESSVPLRCFGIDDASIDVSASGGTGTLTYTLNPGALSNTTGDFTNLAPGNYTVRVTDDNGCFVVSSVFNLSYPPQLVIDSDVSTGLNCNGIDDGSITISASGGTGSLTYTLNPGAIATNTTGIFTGIAPGTYTVNITDDNGCSLDSNPFTFVYPPAINIDSETFQALTCNGINDASISVSASGGTGTLTYTLNPGSITNTNGDFTGLGPGVYTVDVTDANSCGPVTSTPVTFNYPAAIVINSESSIPLTCFGIDDASIAISASGGTGTLTYTLNPGAVSNTTGDFTSLGPGNYSVTVTDDNGCFEISSVFNLVYPPAITIDNESSTIPNCDGVDDGTITIAASGGTGSLTYTLNPGAVSNATGTFPGLGPGDYTITVSDDNGCSVNSNLFSLSYPPAIVIDSETTTGITCHAADDASITVTASGGTGTLTYTLNPGAIESNTTGVFIDLMPGIYSVAVSDPNGCGPINSNDFTFTEPAAFNVVVEPTSNKTLACFGDNNGSLDITVTGGTQPYRYNWTGPNGFSDTLRNISGLEVGLYNLMLLDSNDCAITYEPLDGITSPPEIIILPPDITHVSTCWGDPTGAFTVHVLGGTGIKEFSLEGGPFLSDSTFTNLPGGDYNVVIRDAMGCLVPTIVTINSPAAIATDTIIISPATCYGDTDGSIEIRGSGGTAPYNYTLNPGTLSNTTGIFTNLLPGTYTVTIEDTQACPSYTTPALEVLEPAPFLVDSVVPVDITCGGLGNGMVEIFASGGLMPYSYSADDGFSWDTSSVIRGLGPGNYVTIVRAVSGCMAWGDTITMVDPPVLSLDTYTSTDITTCAGDSAGTITVSASGGTGSLEYSMDSVNWQPNGDFVNQPAGIHIVLVRDSKACVLAFPPLTIDEPPAIIALITTETSLNGQPGSISISASGGTGSLEYSIDGPDGPFGTETEFSVWPEFYIVVVRDQNTCTYVDTVEVTATPPLEVNVAYTIIDCHNENDATISLTHLNGTGSVLYSIDDGVTFQASGNYTDLPGDTYLVHVKDDDRRIFRDTIEIINPDALTATSAITPATCSHFTYDGAIDLTVTGGRGSPSYLWSNDSTSQDLGGLEAGVFSVIITDTSNCQFMETYTVDANTPLVADAGNDTTVCRGEEVNLNGSGGTIFFWWPEEGLSNPAISNPVATVNDSATYVLTITEPGGCISKDTITLAVYADLGIDAGRDTTVAEGQSITLHASGGPFTEYQWLPEDGLDNPNIQSPSLVIRQDITYRVFGTTTKGCQESDSINITIAGGLVIYTGFTPNNDGRNDLWDIDFVEYYPNIVVMVYDRWGRQVFYTKGYSSDKRWDGRFNSEDLPTGTYYYVVNLNDGSEPYKGPVTIVR